MFNLNNLLRPHILSLTPYSSARDEYTGTIGVFLDANENPIGSTTNAGDYNRYPDPHQWAIKQRLAPIKGVRVNQIFLGNGSDEPIDLLVRATCVPGKDNILIMPPTYGMYEVSAAVNDVALIKVPLTPDYQIDTEAVLAAITENTKLIWLCSPNNPSGNLLQADAIHQILEAADHSLVIVDEAYIDFANTPSWTTQLNTYPNLLVLQTFSKAWGLAALRLGMCFASEELIQILNKIKPPYNISAPTQALALEALLQVSRKDEMVAQILTDRQALAEKLRSLPSVRVVHPSDANFLLVQFDNAKQVFDYLIEQQVIVRDRSKVKLCDGCLRISVGTQEENERLLDVLWQMNATPVLSELPTITR
ncbi:MULTISPECIES: histidinol-phosphate transaminase [unclassified Spirosoma]|uniref:histidinol-phosphate transaminase n=1 Tax=unclassified Spirosoma TaxID=2621999 RepID=UPI00095DC498|nr:MULTISPECIES: histidinol-phosphate transaminase [unclassified Spirosoma]MBN8824376.1 histidinol-phosphate transaminase [Spirosoma sp.]OJW70160.1 MAG: histidinol-phosphate transaminase [Spirosoma sp. 48-14]